MRGRVEGYSQPWSVELLTTVEPALERRAAPPGQDDGDRQRVGHRLCMNVTHAAVATPEQATSARTHSYDKTATLSSKDKQHFSMPNDVKTYHDACYRPGNLTRTSRMPGEIRAK
jgi:hypothetical protein